MKKYFGFKNRKGTTIRYLYKLETSKSKSGKIGFWLMGFALLFGLSFWYVIIAGAPQFDGPQQWGLRNKLSYQLETYQSQAMGQERTYGICLPPGYSRNLHQHYPVVFLLHGGHGNPTDWFKKAAALSTIEELYATGKFPPSIIITPDGNDLRGSSPFFDPQYIDGPNGQVSTAIGDELVKLVQNRYRTLPSPAFWAMGGLSSGGWGALNIGLHHLNHFSVLFSHSGYFTDQSGAENSPSLYIKKIPQPARSHLRIYLDAGEQDGKYLDETQRFATVLEQLQVEHVMYSFPGGHGLMGANSLWNYWHKHLADSLTYVGKQFHQAKLCLDAEKPGIHLHRPSPALCPQNQTHRGKFLNLEI